MGSVRLDLSPENIHRENNLLFHAMREHHEIPHDRFWNTVYQRYEKSILQTGSDRRFAHYHPLVAKEFRQFDRWQSDLRLRAHNPSTAVPHTVVGASTQPVSEVTCSVPEPSSLTIWLVGIALIAASLHFRKDQG